MKYISIVSSVQRFIKIESLSSILLFLATIVALFWANSALSEHYQSLIDYKIGISTEDVRLNKPLLLWINDGLMAVFFFLLGLEIKRELLIGELNSLRKASLPVFAAIGGMIIPVLFFLLINTNADTRDGWGISMATDVAFSLAILSLLGDRVPLGLKIFLTAFAIIDDLGAVLVIALFYSSNIGWMYLLYAFIPLCVLYVLAAKRIYNPYMFFLVGVFVWFFFLKSGVHPTIAGILLAFSIPVNQRIRVNLYIRKLNQIVDKIKEAEDTPEPILSHEQIEQIGELEEWTQRVQSPLQHLEHNLHKWVAYFIIPIFALANAGIVFEGGMQIDFMLASAIAIGLIFGKSIGITLFSYIGVSLGLADVPEGGNFRQIIGIGFLAGIGFTMSIFISSLAFADNPQIIDSAKVGIFAGSIISGLVGYLILRMNPSKESSSGV